MLRGNMHIGWLGAKGDKNGKETPDLPLLLHCGSGCPEVVRGFQWFLLTITVPTITP